MDHKTFTAYYTTWARGGESGDHWVSISLMQRPQDALIESHTRIKAKDFTGFKQTVALRTNSSNNTIFADARGNIAYFHASYIPRRDTAFDWTPARGWQQSRHRLPGPLVPRRDPPPPEPRQRVALQFQQLALVGGGGVESQTSGFPRLRRDRYRRERSRASLSSASSREPRAGTLGSLNAAMFDSYLPSFERMLPPLIRAYDQAPATDSFKTRLADQIALLRTWDYRWGVSSIPTSLAVYWGLAAMRG